VRVKLLLRHNQLSSAGANNYQNQLTRHASKTKLRGGLLAHRLTDGRCPSSRPLLSVPQKVRTGTMW
jgi:hypothetical protein